MTSNPYEPFTTQILQDHSVAARLNWHAILIAIAICLGVSLIVGFGFGFYGEFSGSVGKSQGFGILLG